MSSLVKEAENLRKGLVSDMDRSMYNDDPGLLADSNNHELNENTSDHDMSVDLKHHSQNKRK